MLPIPTRSLLATLCCLSLHTVAEADAARPQPSPAAQQAAPAPAPKQGGPEIWILSTTQILVENGCTDAIPKLTEVIRTSPNDSMAFNSRGNCYREANDPNRALADYQTALRLEPNRVTAWISVATAYNDLRNREQALLYYQRARTLDPANARAAEGVGAALHHLKRDAEALTALNEALRLGPDNFRLYVYRGATYNRLRRFPEAEADLIRAAELAPTETISLIALADVYAKQGKHQERVAALEKAQRIEPQNEATRRLVAEANLDLMRAGKQSPTPAGGSTAPPPAQSPGRPAPEVCRRMLMDEIGAVVVDAARPVIQARFREVITGTVPNTQNLRLEARGSGCDDPRANAVLYDFDAGGVLRAITMVWARPPGPTPAPIFSERARLLARWYPNGLTQSKVRLEGKSDERRVILQDMPEQGVLLEAYAE